MTKREWFRMVCVAVVLMYNLPVQAASMVLDNGPFSLRLMETECDTPNVLQYIKPEAQKHYQTANVYFMGEKVLDACWRVSANDPSAVLVIDETGDYGSVPQALFRLEQ